MRYGRIELIEHPQAYLYKMASNVAAEWAMRGRYVRSREPQWFAGLAGEDQAEDCVVYSPPKIRRPIAALPPIKRISSAIARSPPSRETCLRWSPTTAAESFGLAASDTPH